MVIKHFKKGAALSVAEFDYSSDKNVVDVESLPLRDGVDAHDRVYRVWEFVERFRTAEIKVMSSWVVARGQALQKCLHRL